MKVIEKIKTIDNKTEQKKTQYNLDRQMTEILALSSGDITKYEFCSLAKMFYRKKT